MAYALHDLVHTMDQQATALLRPLGMTLRHHTALAILAEHPGIPGRDLAAGLQVTAPATTAIVKRLLAEGWVDDRAPVGSGHRQALHLTDRGRSALRRSSAALGTPFDEVVRAAGHDPQALASALADIIARLRAHPN